MKTIRISEFKARCIRILKDVRRTSEPVIVTHRGVPMARVEPVVCEGAERMLGGLKGRIKIQGDIVHSDLDEDWS